MKKTLIILFLFLFGCDAGMGIFHTHNKGLCIEITQYGSSDSNLICNENTTQNKCISGEPTTGYSSSYSYWLDTNMTCDQFED